MHIVRTGDLARVQVDATSRVSVEKLSDGFRVIVEAWVKNAWVIVDEHNYPKKG